MIVLDTCIVIWDALCPNLISTKARQAITKANKAGGIIICDISLWEIAMLINKKRLQIDADYKTFINLVLNANQYKIAAITPEIVDCSVNLPKSIVKDPADRLITATAITKGCALVTADTKLRKAKEIPTMW